ncbi:hypothetical protein DICVIV_07500 [Dictyocaulus viviparus]|uniref:Thrombospondin type 1 domain protein n=1 Tax=Dictyocaulus viviparus TaxID=29172 RepID=A0A0D8XVP2_DICVI|nr:hypothetical protein DICVIV_07500 [Dictyocaulus viviparus]
MLRRSKKFNLFSVVLLLQCQCIPTSNAIQLCLPYDLRFQAATLEEAMLTFPDLTIDQDDTTHRNTLESEGTCRTQECLDCQEDIRQKLQQVGLIAVSPNVTVDLQRVSTCTKYGFTKKNKEIYGKETRENDSDSSSEEDDAKKGRQSEEIRNDNNQRYRRQKRQTQLVNTTTEGILGERFVLSCTSKGIASGTRGTVSLCSSCWIWRRLPANYSPQFINELVCNSDDASCLSGYASCVVGHRAVEVSRNESGRITTVVLSSGSYCECRPASLVIGDGVGATLPPLGTLMNDTPIVLK